MQNKIGIRQRTESIDCSKHKKGGYSEKNSQKNIQQGGQLCLVYS